MSQHIEQPTFQTSMDNTTDTLDLVISDDPERIKDLRIGPILGKITKAHLSVEFEVNIKEYLEPMKFSSTQYMYKRGNYLDMNEELLNYDWSDLIGDCK
jgi:hypothetical protein